MCKPLGYSETYWRLVLREVLREKLRRYVVRRHDAGEPIVVNGERSNDAI